jgi:hypothetical protein
MLISYYRNHHMIPEGSSLFEVNDMPNVEQIEYTVAEDDLHALITSINRPQGIGNNAVNIIFKNSGASGEVHIPTAIAVPPIQRRIAT